MMMEIARKVFPGDVTVEVNLVGERRMAELNRTYRKGSGASSILTFSYPGDRGSEPEDDSPVGEIYLCWNPLVSEARKRRVSNKAYLLRILVHGLCHLQGFGHGDEESERRMENAEKALLGKHVSTAELSRLFA
jgi:probable rRNA maturation factor